MQIDEITCIDDRAQFVVHELNIEKAMHIAGLAHKRWFNECLIKEIGIGADYLHFDCHTLGGAVALKRKLVSLFKPEVIRQDAYELNVGE